MRELLEEIYKDTLKKRGNKFLGVIKFENLKFLEELLNTDLGIRGRLEKGEEPRRKRPFIGWYISGEELKLVFLTRRKQNPHVNLRLCKRCPNLYEDTYIFRDRKRSFVGYILKSNTLKDFILCGSCEDLEYLESLRFYRGGY
ncbi:hypothetical protein JCM9492_10760 [Aquifex pyrophilus]